MLKSYDFECVKCQTVFGDLVEGCDGQPDICPKCRHRGPFTRMLSAPAIPNQIIVDYPGSKRLKAGYSHVYNRPAEKKDSQVSMFNPKKR